MATHQSRISHEEPAAHCPFLNRADSRCSENFNLDRLGYAFRYCFDQYKACPNYLELLVERRVKRAQETDGKDGFIPERPSTQIVQLTVRSRELADGYAQHAAGL